MSNDSYATKYRPQSFDQVVGQDLLVSSLKGVIERRSSHAFLFVGPSGCGKTTIARLTAAALGCAEIREIDAATNNGIDDMRTVTESLRYRPMKGAARAIIVDECFSKGTRVSTPSGFVAIEKIKCGDLVFCARGVSKVSRVFENKISLDRIVVVRTDGGSEIVCSRDHLFLTTRGWVKAAGLLKGDRLVKELSGRAAMDDFVLDLWDRFRIEEPESFEMRQLLHSGMRSLRNEFCCDGSAFDMFSYLRKHFGGSKTSRETFGRLLFSSKNCAAAFAARESCDVGKNKQAVFHSYVSQQPGPSCGCSCEDCCNSREERHRIGSPSESWWQRELDEASAYAFGQTALPSRVSNSSRFSREWLSVELQSRSGLSENPTSDRSGWKIASTSETTFAGSEKRKDVEVVRVACVESYERSGGHFFVGDRIDDSEVRSGYVTFYDLEIEKHPSYFVENVCVHNCHAATKQAWQSLLKSVEEPPDWSYWFLCTTDVERVPKTIMTRCTRFEVKPVKWDVLVGELLNPVADAEQLTTSDEVIGVCARMADGSPRQALVNLAVCADLADPQEAAALLRNVIEDDRAGVDLARALMKGALWPDLLAMLQALSEENPEGIRKVVFDYASKAVLGSKDYRRAQRPLAIMDAYSAPFLSSDGFGQLILATARLVKATGV